MTRVIHYICNIKIKDFLLCQYVIYGPRKKSIIDKYFFSVCEVIGVNNGEIVHLKYLFMRKVLLVWRIRKQILHRRLNTTFWYCCNLKQLGCWLKIFICYWNWVSHCCLTPTQQFFQVYHGENKLIFNDEVCFILDQHA